MQIHEPPCKFTRNVCTGVALGLVYRAGCLDLLTLNLLCSNVLSFNITHAQHSYIAIPLSGLPATQLCSVVQQTCHLLITSSYPLEPSARSS